MQTKPILLSASIVVYRSPVDVLSATIESLDRAVKRLESIELELRGCDLVLIDNDAAGEVRALTGRAPLAQMMAGFHSVQILDQQGNIGYGRGHNLVLASLDSRFHLILNPDVVLAPDALCVALRYLEENPDAVMLAPRVHDERGRLQYLCKRYPSVFDLVVRGFFPLRWQRPFARRLARYEMHDVIGGDAVVTDPPLLSGCFMLFRTEALQRLGGFDPRYFLYFEDFDLSLRAHAMGSLVYVPQVSIVHRGGAAARKGTRHIRYFVTSAFRFFSTHGWKFW